MMIMENWIEFFSFFYGVRFDVHNNIRLVDPIDLTKLLISFSL